ncbi:MAG TPA: pentapeptide repeat-containing protein [Pyrinomonadaceae bacterium]|nr:pentapeptide repeat-containing protein [Pyrinomonadaceae bacterium]
MANPEHLAILQQGVPAWNSWREAHGDVVPDLSRAPLRGTNLQGANLNNAILWKADLAEAQLHRAKLREANLRKANFFAAALPHADLYRANLTGAQFVDTNLENTNLTGCFVYGVSVWDANLDGATQHDLVTADRHSSSNEWKPDDLKESLPTVDDIEVAQLVYLLQANQKVRNVVDTVSSKVVLILGRFTRKRKAVLDAIKERIRGENLVPIIFDFEGPDARNLTETIVILAALARFVIADITDAKSIPQELHAIVPALPSLPVQPIILASQHEYGMFKDFAAYLSVLSPFRYNNTDHLLESFNEGIIGPVTRKAAEIAERRQAFEK